jgi:hypothetical protein
MARLCLVQRTLVRLFVFCWYGVCRLSVCRIFGNLYLSPPSVGTKLAKPWNGNGKCRGKDQIDFGFRKICSVFQIGFNPKGFDAFLECHACSWYLQPSRFLASKTITLLDHVLLNGRLHD